MKIQGRVFKIGKVFLAAGLVAMAGIAVVQRFPECFGAEDTALAAAAFTLTDGRYRPRPSVSEPTSEAEKTAPAEQPVRETEPLAKKETAAVPAQRDKSGYYDSFAAHEGEEKYVVTEKSIDYNGTPVGSGEVWNRTGLDFDFDAILKTPLTFGVKKNAEAPQVLIYHTHTGEAYLDEDVDYFYESYYSRTQNEAFNVVGVGDALAASLERQGIRTLHDKTVHDSTYNGSYDRSAGTVYADIADNSDIKIVLDIHRDALGTEENKVKTVFEHDGEKAAQIMILSGCDCYGERGFDNWQNNLSFALKLEDAAEEMYPGMTRPVSFDFFAYNEYICDGSLLIEIGTDANSIEEAERTASYLGEVIARVVG